MDTRVKEMARAALASGINRPVLEYFEAKLVDAQAVLLSCDEKMFKVHQGKAQELVETIAFIKSAK